jgi:hypothetical protein
MYSNPKNDKSDEILQKLGYKNWNVNKS